MTTPKDQQQIDEPRDCTLEGSVAAHSMIR